jgi:hypothetical protein
MRQDYVREMNDPHQRRQYAEADAADRWAPKSTRGFEHSADVTSAWKNLARTISDGQLQSDPSATSAAIAEHLNRSIPPLTGHDNARYISVDPTEISFGPDWSAHEIADLVARDFLPDAELSKAIDAARTDPTS